MLSRMAQFHRPYLASSDPRPDEPASRASSSITLEQCETASARLACACFHSRASAAAAAAKMLETASRKSSLRVFVSIRIL